MILGLADLWSGFSLFDMERLTLSLIVVAVFSSGCLNMPTAESQISGSYVSPQKYKNYSDVDLTAEINSLSRRESQLKTAQNQRVKTSRTKAFWWGFGDGDGIEASELANVRGSIEAARREQETRKEAAPEKKKP